MEKSKKYMEEIKSFHCCMCNSNLVLKYLNQSQRITLCSNKEVNHNFNDIFNILKIQCLFPLQSSEIDKFIFDESKEKWEDYIINIKKLLSQNLIFTTNDTFLEDKNNISKIEEKNISFNLGSLDSNEENLFSFDYDEKEN